MSRHSIPHLVLSLLISISAIACQSSPTSPTPPPETHPAPPDRLPTPTPPPTTTVPDPLTVNFTGVPSGLVAGTVATFYARADHVVGTAHYAWTVDGRDDGTTEPILRVTFARQGDHDVRVTATDDRGTAAHATTFVTVARAPAPPAPPNLPPPPTPPPPPPAPAPVPPFTITLVCTAGTSTVCNLTATLRDAGIVTDRLQTVSWSWGDGSVTSTGALPYASHTYPVVGTFTIVVTATLDASHQAQASTTVSVK